MFLRLRFLCLFDKQKEAVPQSFLHDLWDNLLGYKLLLLFILLMKIQDFSGKVGLEVCLPALMLREEGTQYVRLRFGIHLPPNAPVLRTV